MKYILDTNICIYLIKKKPLKVFEKFSELSLGSIGISSITLAELQYGISKSKEPDKNSQALIQFLIPLEVIPFDTNAAIEYGKIKAELERKGTQIGPLDSLIAAHVKALGLILVTNNEREFQRVNGLKVENWTT
jgi:tRNA(fMet)-specific endonuclease VapC